MGVYARHVLPRLINLSMQNKVARLERARFLPRAFGRVLEMGIGSGLNIPFYRSDIQMLCGVDPSPELLRMARRRAAAAHFPVELIERSGESLPTEDQTFDTVVTTWALCTIPNPVAALKEMKRVLKPEGHLIFIEHGRSPDARVLAWQNRLNPLWNRLGGGCNLNRKIDDLIVEAGFRITQMDTGYGKGPRLLAYLYKGLARRPS